MVVLSTKGFRSIASVLAISLGLGCLGSIALVIQAVVSIFRGTYALPVVLPDGLVLTQQVHASTLGLFIAYEIALIGLLALVLAMVALLYRMVASLTKSNNLNKHLPSRIRWLSILLLVLSYVRQLLLYLTSLCDLGPLEGLVQFRFQLLPSQAIFALVLLLLSQLFCYALVLQDEYEQTV